MTLPAKLDVRLEVQFDDEWVDLGAQVDASSNRKRLRTVSPISRGRADESSQTSPASFTGTLDNTDGTLTPTNPQSPYWPFVDVDAPARVSVPNPSGAWLQLPDSIDAGQGASAPDSAGLSVTGDLWLAFDFTPRNDVSGSQVAHFLASKWAATSDERSWRLWRSPTTGRFLLHWSADGINVTGGLVPELPPPEIHRRQIIGLHFDVNNGAGGHTLSLYTADEWGDPWTLLGSVTGSGATSIYDGTAPVELGTPSDGDQSAGFDTPVDRIHRFEMRSGDDTGTLRASPDFTVLDEGDPSVVDAQGNTWTVTGDAEVTDREYRIVGTVGAWRPAWPAGDIADPSIDHPGFSLVDVEIGGPLRKLNRGTSQLRSALRRAVESTDPADAVVVDYWPFESDSGAANITNPGNPASISGAVSFSQADGFGGTDGAGSVSVEAATFVTRVADFGVTTFVMLDMWIYVGQDVIDSLSGGDFVEPWRIFNNGGAGDVFVRIDASGNIHLLGNGGDVSTSFPTDRWVQLHLQEVSNGVDGTNLILRMRSVGSDSWQSLTGPLGGETEPQLRPSRIERHGFGFGEGTFRFGHLIFSKSTTPTAVADLYPDAAAGWLGEHALDRFGRLTDEEGVAGLAWPGTWTGSGTTPRPMGVQRPGKFLDLLRECADATIGIMGEQVNANGLSLRTADSIVNQTPALTLDAAQSQIANPFAPTKDDQRSWNQVTASRVDGGQFTATVTPEPGPADLVSTGVTVNVESDTQLPGVAGWLLHLYDWPEMRTARITVDLAVRPELIPDVLTVRHGDLIHITNLPAQFPTGTLDLIVQGDSDTLGSLTWTWSANCTPGGPWQTGVIADETTDLSTGSATLGRCELADGTLGAAIDDDDTSLTFLSSEPYWINSTDEADMFPFDVEIGGEQMTVTAITGAASPQTATVIRSVNNITKSHPSGAEVHVAAPLRAFL